MHISRLAIKQLLFLIVAIIAVPAVCIIIYTGMYQRKAAIQNAKMETQELVETIVSEHKNLLASTRQLFIALSQLRGITAHNQGEVEVILADILKLSPQYTNILIADPAGKVWASGLPLKESLVVADRRYFRNALASGRLSSGEYLVGRSSNKAMFNLGYPLKDAAGKVTSVICVGLSLDYYRDVFAAYNMPAGASFVLIDHKGTILTRAVDPIKYMGKQSNPEIFRYMQGGPEQETSIGASSAAGDLRIQTYRKLQLEGEATPYLYVRAGIPVDIVMAGANRTLLKNLSVYVASLLVGLLISWRIGKKYIIDRVLVLEQSSRRLADGDLTSRVAHLVTGGELGTLGQTLDTMAGRIADDMEELQRKADEYHAIIQTTSDGFNICAIDGRILAANDSYCKMVGYSLAELTAMNIADIDAVETCRQAEEHIDSICRKGSDSFISRHKRKDGTEIDVEVTTTYLNKGGGQLYSFVRDITEKKKLEDELLRAATYDSLTAVLNRRSMEEKTEAELERAKRYGNKFSLVMFDVDDFKRINDTYGHLAGDAVLQDIARVMGNNLRILDALGRWGGEEFMILLAETEETEAVKVAEKLRSALADYRADAVGQVTASFGVTTCQPEDTLDSMVKRVDDLMYLAKNSGKNRIMA